MAGQMALLSRAITLVESRQQAHRDLAAQILERVAPHAGKSFRLGITGVPGVGKSTFIESFGSELLQRGHRVAVLAVDPSSSKSHGSILGDKTRMEKLSASPGAFIRPSPSSGTLGGVTNTSWESILLCEAAGYDFIIVETVGVGQSETTVSNITDFFLLLMLAGAGDELQGIKRGIMEMADAVVITKADGSNAARANAARNDYAHAMHLLPPAESGWTPRVQTCSALTGEGITAVYDMLASYRSFATTTGYFARKRQAQQHQLVTAALEEQLKHTFFSDPLVTNRLELLRSTPGQVYPRAFASEVLDEFFQRHRPM